jgi:hypothetical protein
MTTFYCLRFEPSPNLEGQVPVFISLRNRVAQLYPQALGSLFVGSHDSQGYGGGIGTRFLTEYLSRYNGGLWLDGHGSIPGSARFCLGSVVESESELLYDWRFTANQVVFAPGPLRLTARIFFLN